MNTTLRLGRFSHRDHDAGVVCTSRKNWKRRCCAAERSRFNSKRCFTCGGCNVTREAVARLLQHLEAGQDYTGETREITCPKSSTTVFFPSRPFICSSSLSSRQLSRRQCGFHGDGNEDRIGSTVDLGRLRRYKTRGTMHIFTRDIDEAPLLEGIYPKPKLEDLRGFRNNGSLFPKIPNFFTILKVQKVNNACLYGMYLLHKEELINESIHVEEKLLYHVTSPRIATECIAIENINWRKTQRTRYGIGACFARCPVYAHRYASSRGAIVICSVLIQRKENVDVSYGLNVPTYIDYDTTLSLDGEVYVKYDDYTFYPKFIIHYSC